MIIAYTAVLFCLVVLTGFTLGTCQPLWLSFIVPIAAYTMYQLVRAILKIQRQYRTQHAVFSLLSFCTLFFAMLALMQVPGGHWWRVLQHGIFVPVYIALIVRGYKLYYNSLEIDAKIQKWKDEMDARQKHWAELYP